MIGRRQAPHPQESDNLAGVVMENPRVRFISHRLVSLGIPGLAFEEEVLRVFRGPLAMSAGIRFGSAMAKSGLVGPGGAIQAEEVDRHFFCARDCMSRKLSQANSNTDWHAVIPRNQVVSMTT